MRKGKGEERAVEAELSEAGGDLCIHSYLHLSSAASVCASVCKCVCVSLCVFCAHILLLYFRCGCG